MLKTQDFCIRNNLKAFLDGETSFPNLKDINTKNYTEKEILIRLLLSIYKNKEEKYEELKKIINKILNSDENNIFKFLNNSLESVNNNKVNIFSNKSIPKNNKIFSIYSELLKFGLNKSSKFVLILEAYYILKDISKKYFNNSLKGRIFVTSGFGDIGLAISQAIKYLGGIAIIIDVNPYLLRQREKEGFCNYVFEDFTSAFDFAFSYKKEKQSKIIGLLGNGSEIINKILDEGLLPDIITDTTNTDLNKYFPSGYDYYDAVRINKIDNHHSKNISKHSIMMLVKAMLELQKRGSFIFEFANNFREIALERGLDNAFAIRDIEEIISENLLNNNKTNIKFMDIFNNKENLFLINDLLYQSFSDEEDIKINSEIFLNLIGEELEYFYLKFDKEQLYLFLEEIKKLIYSNEIITPLILGRSTFDKSTQLDTNNNFINTKSSIDDFNIRENYIILDENTNLNSDLEAMFQLI